MSASFVGAIDQGTTSSRFIAFDHSGKILATHQIEHKQIYQKPGWCEHDAEEIMHNVETCVHEALAKSSIHLSQLQAIGITNQRETSLIWDRVTGKPFYNAIVWHDTRTIEIVHRLKNGEGEGFLDTGADRFRTITGLPIATYFSAVKIMWMLENVPGLRAKAESGNALFGNMDTWLIWKLSGGANGGVHVTDVTNASRTNLMNLVSLQWDDDILKCLNIPKCMLPAIKSSSEVYASGHKDSVIPDIPISGDLGDQQAALFGQTCFSPGDAKNTYGTGCFFMMNTGLKPMPSNKGLLTTVGYKIGDRPPIYALEGSISYAGSLVQWLRDNLKLIKSAPDVEKYAKKVKDNGGVYLVPAFSGLFAPRWRNDARGVMVGLTSFANRDHVCRAALEATAFQTQEVVAAMEADSGVHLTKLKVDGGMVVNQTLMQFQSDVLDVPVVCPVIAETTALGAAYAAGLAVGFWNDIEELREKWQVGSTWNPDMEAKDRIYLLSQWNKAVERTLNWEEQ
ncbi:glycerol kinase [Plasmopara halstedii]|uniref:glycerol kinase n=1 Tax=Plasmopara halstedii TaxID=4781 RepID=A0A0P1ALE5_PLAHL|nr:glycerol kinase [Plasmopara halstedii]CEG42105.1 glycerol kinase [Plasmopara halstedii]|eukprot:XP_024578474.1 glycerol kinase [Plasmopara halstedii]